MAESVKVPTETGAKVTTFVTAAEATAGAPAEPDKAMIFPDDTAEDAKPPTTTDSFPEDAVKDKYSSFEAPNYLLKDECVGLVRARYLESCAGPIDIRQNLPAENLFHGPLELGDERAPPYKGSMLMPITVAIALSYTWAPRGPPFGNGKDHPDPEKFYLALVQRVLAFMFRCHEYSSKIEQTFVFWDWMSLYQNYTGDLIEMGERNDQQQAAFARCMNNMHLWYGNAHIHTWMITTTAPYNKRQYKDRGWCVGNILSLHPNYQP